MSRWADDPERAADELIQRGLDTIDPHGRVLLANHNAPGLPTLLDARGTAFVAWHRRLTGGGKAEPWPPSGPFEVALLRLPKARDEQQMAAHACLSVLAPGGRLVVYGGNDEGIRSAAAMVRRLCGTAETLAARGHGRVVAAVRAADLSGLRATLAAWRSTTMLQIGGVSRAWTSYPGIFAADRIDEGTALLIGALPPLRTEARVLDYGCGSGVIGAAAAASVPGIRLDLLDSDSAALEAAHANVPGARTVLGTSVRDVRDVHYDVILSNPPLHQGVAEDHTLLERLIADAPAHLKPDGVLQIVVQRRIPLDRLLAARFATVSVVAENGRFRVWRAVA
jgi:16S rRNA (guanine1207-N2)-methyltransferase